MWFWIWLEAVVIVALLIWNMRLKHELRIAWDSERNWVAIAMRYVRREIGNPSEEDVKRRLLELRGKAELVQTASPVVDSECKPTDGEPFVPNGMNIMGFFLRQCAGIVPGYECTKIKGVISKLSPSKERTSMSGSISMAFLCVPRMRENHR